MCKTEYIIINNFKHFDISATIIQNKIQMKNLSIDLDPKGRNSILIHKNFGNILHIGDPLCLSAGYLSKTRMK